MERLYFACRIRTNGSEAFVIWYQDDRDGFVRGPDGQLINATSLESLAVIASKMGVSLGPEAPAKYDFDRLRDWCRHPIAETVEYADFLNSWNFFDDLAALHENPDSSYAQLSRSGEQSYDKLFWGNNLPSITPPCERFIPTWAADELDIIRKVMETGIGLLEAELQAAARMRRFT